MFLCASLAERRAISRTNKKNNRIKKVKNVFVVRENALAATPAARIKASRTLTSRKFLK
jgi:hypothetical protein